MARVRPVLERERIAIEGEAKAVHLSASSAEVVERVCLFQNASSGDIEITHDNEEVEKFVGLRAYQSESVLGSIRTALEREESFCLMAYGQTGSGKTYTCMEILPHISDMLLNHSMSLDVELSAFELHLETVVDLLTPEGKEGQDRTCTVRQDAHGKIRVDAHKIVLKNLEDAKKLVNAAFAKRASSSTKSNEHSSRSHAFFRYSLRSVKEMEVRKENKDREEREMEVTIVDLAGNERYEDAFHHDSARLAEMKSINGSLGCLKECLRDVLQKKGTTHYIPYRRSKLTTILKDCLDPDSRGNAFLVAHLAPVRTSLKHSLNTLRLVTQIVEKDSLAERERKNFSGPAAWSASQMVEFVRTLQDGRFESLADSFHVTGKLFSVEWRGHVVKRVVAAGGTEGDAEVIYDAFHEHLSRHKEKEKAKVGGMKAGRSALAATRAKAKAAFARNFSQDDVVVLEKQKK